MMSGGMSPTGTMVGMIGGDGITAGIHGMDIRVSGAILSSGLLSAITEGGVITVHPGVPIGATGMVRTGMAQAKNIGAITDVVTLTGVESRPGPLIIGAHWFITPGLWRRNPPPRKTELWCRAAAMERSRGRRATPRVPPANLLSNAPLRLAAPMTIAKPLRKDQRPAAKVRIKTYVVPQDLLIPHPRPVCAKMRGVRALPAPAALEPTVRVRVQPAEAACPVPGHPAHPALRVPAAAAAVEGTAAAAVPVPAVLPQADAIDRAHDRNG